MDASAPFREQQLQSSLDNLQINRLQDYIEASPGSWFTKFDNFPKYVQRSALSRFLVRYELFKMQLEVAGSIVDIGVGRGASLMTWAQLSAMFEPVNYTREVVGFDTFSGIVAMAKEDSSQHNQGSNLAREGGFKTEAGVYEDLQKAVEVYDITRPLNHIPKVTLVKGDVAKTLPGYLEQNPHLVVSLLNLDADLFEPTKVGLDYLEPRMPKGAVVIFDELNVKCYPGETVAVMKTLGLGALQIKRFPWATTIAYAVKQ